MIGIIIGAIKIIILLGFLVFIHEFGHFTVAKLCKVKVNEFSLGFGPVIFKKQGKETKYVLRLIPFGGFVSMEGEVEKSEEERAFNKVSIPKRIAIVAAGGLVNIIFAIIVFLPLQMAIGNNATTKVESIMPNYAAETYDIRPGDVIKKVDGKNVKILSDINKIIEKSNGKELTLVIERDGNKIEKKVIPTGEEYYTTGMYFDSKNSTKVQGFMPEESIESQGFKIGDTIISINGENVENNVDKMSEIMENYNGEGKIEFVIKRIGGEHTIEVKPIKKVRYLLGIKYAIAENNFGNRLYYGIINTGDFAFSMIENMKQLFTGKVRTSDFMGPVGISKAVAKTDGIASFITMLALISLSLGVTNLLPFPPLDGGKIVLLIIEAIRKKPIEEKYEIGIQMLGFGLMIMLSLYITYHDILRLI